MVTVLKRVLRAIDSGMTAFIDDTQRRMLGIPAEPALTDDELVAVRQLIEDRFPVHAATTASPLKTRPIAEGGAVSLASAVGARDGTHRAPTDGTLTADELHYAAAAIRCWMNGVGCDLVNPDYYHALADRLSTAALELTPVST